MIVTFIVGSDDSTFHDVDEVRVTACRTDQLVATRPIADTRTAHVVVEALGATALRTDQVVVPV